MLAKTLARMIDSHLTNAKEIGELTGVAPSTVYRWVRGESQPDFDAIRLLVRHLKKPEAVEALLSAFIAGTAWSYHNLDAELDVNRDGAIDASDALDASIEAVRAASRSLAQVREACRDGLLERDAVIELIALLNDVIRHCSVTQQVLVHMSESRPRRKLLKLAK